MGHADSTTLQLDEWEESLLAGAQGPAAAKAMELLVALAKIYGARKMVPVRSVQVAGVSYHNLGAAGLEYLEETARDGRVGVDLATLNPAGMDLEAWRRMGIDEEFAGKQLRVVEAYRKMGISMTLTCTPYLAGNLPMFGESVAWAESSAVTFANSVLGARTNREGGPAALAAALVGRVPLWGLHLEAERRPNLHVVVKASLREPVDWGILGAHIGRRQGSALPLITLETDASPDMASLKALSAALPTYGARPMFHIRDVTPEASAQDVPDARMDVTDKDLEETGAAVQDAVEDVEMVCLGCPHATVGELRRLASMLAGRRVKVPVWISVSRPVYDAARSVGLVSLLEEAGAVVARDTCFVVAPLKGKVRSIATDSAKGCYYSRGHNDMAVRLGTTEQCVEAALTGRFSG